MGFQCLGVRTTEPMHVFLHQSMLAQQFIDDGSGFLHVRRSERKECLLFRPKVLTQMFFIELDDVVGLPEWIVRPESLQGPSPLLETHRKE